MRKRANDLVRPPDGANVCNHTDENVRELTAHDWEDEKNRSKDFHDDGTMSFFWNAHTLTCLVFFSIFLFYVAVLEKENFSSEYNLKRGISAMIIGFLVFGIVHTPDGPFKRPHPAVWRFVLCLSILYELILVFILFQNIDDARQWLRYIDPGLGNPLPEKDYGGNCLIYDSHNKEDPWHNVKEKMDGFVICHLIGWWAKTLMLRDFWLCNVLSFTFEVLEYSFEHQLPNFSECWWDHWIMDFLVCNLAGILIGMKTLTYLSMKPYHWRGMWKIPGYRGKLKRLLLQFTPHRWTDFDWGPTNSLKRWAGTVFLITMILIAELNTFYLKYVLWVPPPHFLCLGRLVFFVFMGAAAIRETFQYFDDPNCDRFGRQSWLISSVIITELLIIVKFGWETITKPLPKHIVFVWMSSLFALLVWTFWHFYIKRLLTHLSRSEHSVVTANRSVMNGVTNSPTIIQKRK